MMIVAWLIGASMTPGVRYTGWRWRYLARFVRRRDHYRCTNPHCPGGGGPLDVHHRRLVSAGGSHLPTNLTTLCRACHQAEHGYAF